jgi:AraC family transcriptional regulator
MSDLLRPPRPQGRTHPGVLAGTGMARSISRELRDKGRLPLRLVPDSDHLRHRFRGGLPGGALRRVRTYIDDHIGERISLDELASQAGVSRFHFARQFRLSTGESAMGYLRRMRIERSKSILQTRGSTIAEVAARLGFSDQSHFTRIFGRLVGVSPGSFARRVTWSPRPGLPDLNDLRHRGNPTPIQNEEQVVAGWSTVAAGKS